MKNEELIQQYLAGEAVGDELLKACREDHALLKTVAAQVAMDRLLRLQAQDDGKFCGEFRMRATAGASDLPDRIRKRLKPRSRFFLYLGPLAAAALVLLFFQPWTAEPLGEVGLTIGAQWDGPLKGEPVFSGPIALRQGIVQIALNNGVELLLEGPATVELLNLKAVQVQLGKVVAYTSKGMDGFTILTPTAEVIDLGTAFGVNVDPSGRSEVHVLEGTVKSRARGAKQFETLDTSQARVYDLEQKVAAIKNEPSRFLRALPQHSDGQPEYLHWSFDDMTLSCDGPGINGKLYPATRGALPGGDGPQLANGQFGQALYFNGVDAWVETDYRGIGNRKPRSIALWVKIPADFSATQGYSLMGWGQSRWGRAWQISANPSIKDGPLGRVRIGTIGRQAIGTTDLRDDRWHHVAVVLYGGREVDLSTHLLLYVDGQLEATSHRSFKSWFNTKLHHPNSRPVFFGLNISYKPERPGMADMVDKFFKGWLDEVYIFNTALNQEQIQSLMKNNRLPE